MSSYTVGRRTFQISDIRSISLNGDVPLTPGMGGDLKIVLCDTTEFSVDAFSGLEIVILWSNLLRDNISGAVHE